MFNREASLNVMGPFGQLSLGKIGAITQGTSSWGKVGAVSAFGTSYGAANVANATNVFSAPTSVADNMIAYQTPKFAGFTVYAQYSMGNSKAGTTSTPTQVENKSSTDRYLRSARLMQMDRPTSILPLIHLTTRRILMLSLHPRPKMSRTA